MIKFMIKMTISIIKSTTITDPMEVATMNFHEGAVDPEFIICNTYNMEEFVR